MEVPWVASGAVGVLVLGLGIPLALVVVFGVRFSEQFSQHASLGEKLAHGGLAFVTLLYACVALMAPVLVPACHRPMPAHPPTYANLDHKFDPCAHVRYVRLLGLSAWECDMCVRMMCALVCGSIIGAERRRADRPVGLRTMSAVALAACVFTIDSTLAFVEGSMGWDASRLSAAIPSGVGFLGAATIWKSGGGRGEAPPEVHGLTTATAIWLSAACGLFCGGGLLVPAVYTAVAVVVWLTHAPTSQSIQGRTRISPNPPMVSVQLTYESDTDRASASASAPASAPAPAFASASTSSSLPSAVLFVEERSPHRWCRALGVCQAVYVCVALLQPWLAPPCRLPPVHRQDRNVDYARYVDACMWDRYWALLGVSKWECDVLRRLTAGLVLGAMVGLERRRPDRAAGIRTMSLIALGAAAFGVGGMWCEIKGPQAWDPARVAAAVVSAVGFVGGASLWKGSAAKYEIHGMTSATTVWLAAALGLMAGGGMFTVGLFSACVAVLYLRFGPRPAQMPLEADAGPSSRRALHA